MSEAEDNPKLLSDLCSRFTEEPLRGATCACIEAVKLGVSGRVSRTLLEYHRTVGRAVRVDAKRVLAARPGLVPSLTQPELQLIQDYPSPLHVYYPTELDAEFPAHFAPIATELALMLRLFDEALHGNGAHLHRTFQHIVQVFRHHAEQWGIESFPIGSEAYQLGLEEHTRSLAEGTLRFEAIDCGRSTQLRVVMQFAQLCGGGPPDRPTALSLQDVADSSAELRRSIVGRLRRALVQGLDLPARFRSPMMRKLTGEVEFVELRPPYNNQVEALAAWLQSESKQSADDPHRMVFGGLLRRLPAEDYPPRRLSELAGRVFPRAQLGRLRLEQLNHSDSPAQVQHLF